MRPLPPHTPTHTLQNFEAAREDINKLRDAIDNQTFAPPLVQLQQRTWLLHWALFVYWNHENGKNDLLDLFMAPPYLAAIQVSGGRRCGCCCPPAAAGAPAPALGGVTGSWLCWWQFEPLVFWSNQAGG